MAKISIITATYDSAKTLPDTIDSVLAQTHQDFEIIVVDGLSKDDTVGLVKRYAVKHPDKIRWISERDNGLYDVMNRGIGMASGEVVGILNSDDFYHDNNVLKLISSEFDRDKDLQCTYGDLQFVDADNVRHVKRTWKGSQYPSKGFSSGWHPAHPTFYARRECFERYGGFDISFEVSADFELMLRFLEKNQLKSRYIDHCLVTMRLGGESTGSIGKIIQGNRNVLRAFEKNGIKKPSFYLMRRLAPKAWNRIKTRLKF